MPQISEIKLAYKSTVTVDTLPTITSPEDAAAYLRSIWDDDQLDLREQFIVVLLDNSRRVLGWNLVSSGGATATIVDISAIFQVSLLGRANSVILSHSHPSGNPNASRADIKLTKRAVKAGELLGISVDDHIILYRDGYTSMKNRGLIWQDKKRALLSFLGSTRWGRLKFLGKKISRLRFIRSERVRGAIRFNSV